MAKFFLIISMSISAMVLFISYNSPISRAISQNDIFYLAFIDKDSTTLGEYNPAQKIFKLIKTTKKIKSNGSLTQNAHDLYYKIKKAEPDRDSLFYIDLSRMAWLNSDYLNNFLLKWRHNPQMLYFFLKEAISSKMGKYTNVSTMDLISCLIETFHLSTSNIIIEEMDISAEDLEDKKIESEEFIKVKIILATNKFKIDLLRSKFKELGFDIIDIKKTNKKLNTELISPSDDISCASKLREKLGINNVSIKIKREKYYIAPVSLTIGDDFKLEK